MVFVGATVEPGLAEVAVAKGWLDDPVTIDMGYDWCSACCTLVLSAVTLVLVFVASIIVCVLCSAPEHMQLLHRGNSLPAGLQHRFVVVPEDRKLAVMARQMRIDLRE